MHFPEGKVTKVVHITSFSRGEIHIFRGKTALEGRNLGSLRQIFREEMTHFRLFSLWKTPLVEVTFQRKTARKSKFQREKGQVLCGNLNVSRRDGMGSFHSFAEVLEKKIRREIEKEYTRARPSSEASRPENSSPNDSARQSQSQNQSETWAHLLGKVETVHFKETRKGETYHRFRPIPKPRPNHVFNPDQQQAFVFFQSQMALPANFSRSELQKAFRILALKFHPDQGGQSTHFQALVKARKQLETLFS